MNLLKVELISITPNAEKVIESAGRTAYLSFDRQGKDTEKNFIQMIIKNGHTSVLEHASATFRIKGVSRALTHQLVRHRLCSFTQQSQRYVNEEKFHYICPESIRNNQETKEIFENYIEFARITYLKLCRLGIKNEDARFVLPNATATEIVVSANLRQWCHIIEIRGNKHAQWEIREMTIKILKILKEYAPSIYNYYNIDEKRKIIIINKV